MKRAAQLFVILLSSCAGDVVWAADVLRLQMKYLGSLVAAFAWPLVEYGVQFLIHLLWSGQ